jgi:hypothetical protein
MLSIYLIPIIPYHKQGSYFYTEGLISLVSHLNTIVDTFTNHSEIIVLYETSRECV